MTRAKASAFAATLRLLAALLLLLGAVLPGAARAATAYSFPGNLPAGCSGSNGNYTCSALSLAWNDSISIATTTRITVNGNFNTSTASINKTGSASSLTLVVNGTLTTGYQTVINANITATAVNDSGGSVTFGGTLTTSTGDVQLGWASTVAGSIRTTSGDITLGGSNAVTGSITSASGAIDTGYASTVGGNVGSYGTVEVGQATTVGGTVTGQQGAVALDYASKVAADTTAHASTLTINGTAAVAACARSTAAKTLTLKWGASAGGVCCGTNCSSSCVSNGSGAATPATCSPAPFTAGQQYSFESWDTAGSYIRHSNFLGYISSMTAGSGSAALQDATFIARAGRYDSTCWSFESVNYPGYYLRHQNFILKLHKSDGSTLYEQDTTFCTRTGLAGAAGISLESINYPGYYIRHYADTSLGIAYADGAGGYAGNATFRVVAPLSSTSALHHLEIRHASGTGLTCTPSTLTVAACQDAACTVAYTGGLSGTLTASGAGMSVSWPDGAGFSIASGSSTTSVRVQVTTAGSVSVGTSALSTSASNGSTCNFGAPACTFTAADSGLLFDVPDHVAQVAQTVSVSAVKKADNSLACVPAFASTTKTVSFGCSYANPSSGSRPVVVGGNNVSCGTPRGVPLAFNASGVASTTVQYADAGQVTLTAGYTGSGSDAGLSMNGSDSFVAAPYRFAVSVAGAGVAGNAFNGTVTAQAYDGSTTPNFGHEAAPEGVTLGWVRTQPQGTGAVNGSFTGSVGAFSGGMATLSNLVWSEVGRGDLGVRLASGSGYLGSGYRPAGSTAGAPVWCANEGGTCALPAGTTATVYYGLSGRVYQLAGQTGNVSCTNTVFGDPYVGTGKQCWYVATGGSSAAGSGAVGPFRPHHFDVAVTPACGGASGFSYAGQPFGTTVTARNASNATTINYDGSASTSPNFAKKVTLTDAPVLGLGSLSGYDVVATLFTSGVASATPSYGFTSKLTAPQTLSVRATDTDTVSSSGYVEGSTALRSGRLRLFNAFGSEKSTLQMQLQAEYWSGSVWALNSLDSCTAVAAPAVALSNIRNHQGGAGTWTTSASTSGTLSGGRGTLTLAAPSGGSTGSVDVALNLGSGAGADQACTSTHPATTGAAASWLRSQNGSCSAAWDRDPSARASFGLYSPETRKTVHVREIF